MNSGLLNPMQQTLRQRVAFALLALAWAACNGLATAALHGSSPPNILIVLGDDHTYLDSGCYGNGDVRTPNMDRLASEGMLFNRAFTATAMCAPSRQQLYTGIFPVRNGAYPNHSAIRDGIETLPSYLQKLGYRVALAGKGHIKPRSSYPFEFLAGPGLNFDTIREFVLRDRGQPFCLIACSSSPHVPWNEGDPSAYNAEQLTIPPHLLDTPEMREALCRYYAEISALDDQLGTCMDLLSESGLEKDTLLMYSSEQGSQHPFCKWTCYETGLHVELIARWPGHIPADARTNAMVQYVDVLPTLIELAGGAVPDTLDGKSFLPVLLGKSDRHQSYVYGVHTTKGIIAGTPEGYPVRSIRDERFKLIRNLNPQATFRDVLIKQDRENYWNSWVELAKTNEAAAARVRKYLHRPAVEFYDLEEDPYELHNLVDQPRYSEQIATLDRKLTAWMEQQGDEGLATELDAGARK